MTTAIKTENLSKIYRLGEIGTGTISHDLERWWARLRGKEDPFLRIGQTNDRTTKGESNLVYSLRDINFEIQQGEAVGIIGKNGAGKSTLLKILSRVTSPTAGKIHIKGRVASLLEVGTGFHPELTGRENIFLNGAILGMRKKEITRKLDEIIDFSGVERYIDTPVKRYSSGMYVRLAFAVAAHLESEILIVDEVLAVGDAEFQKKCLGKMNDVSKSDGRTILFVSHNMAAIKILCQSAIVLSNGLSVFNGEINSAVGYYQNNNQVKLLNDGYIAKELSSISTGQAKILRLQVFDADNIEGNTFPERSKIKLNLTLEAFQKEPSALIDILLVSSEHIEVAHILNIYDNFQIDLEAGQHIYEIEFTNYLRPGNYSFTLGIHHANGWTIDYVENIGEIVIESNYAISNDIRFGLTTEKACWKKIH